MSTYYAEADALARAYTDAVGHALQRGIKVHVGPHMKSLGDLRDEIAAHDKRSAPAEADR